MRTYSEIVIDSETLEIISRTVRHENYCGPVDECKGGAQKALATENAKTGQADASTLLGQSESMQGQLLPFLEGEITNPQGFGQPALNAMTTAAGQGASGAVSNATNQAKLRAARTGNLGGQSAIIANAARSGAGAQANANLDTQIANAQEKMKQQQAGASGVAGLAGEDLKSALASLGLSDESLNSWANVNKSAGNIFSNVLSPLEGAFNNLPGAVTSQIPGL